VQYLCPILHDFLAHHPDVELDINLTDDRIDLVTEGADFVIRLAPLANSALKYRKLGDSERLLAAAPTFIATHGPINTPEDLRQLNAIRVCRVADSKKVRLINADGTDQMMPLNGRFVIDNGLAARDALASGQGFGVTNRWLVQDLLEAGQLIHLLPDYKIEPIPLSILIAPERANIARVRHLIEHIVTKVQGIPGIL
jgi:DNA-binding transcriptional LysR family regulator